MSLNSASSGHEDVSRIVGVLKKAEPNETSNNYKWFNKMRTHLAGRGLAWVIEPTNSEYAEMKELEMQACGDDKAKQAGVKLRWLKAESQVKSMLMSTVDESYCLDITSLPAKEAWKALQPANQANVLLKMVTDVLRERLADHKSVGQFLTKVRAAMTQLFSDSDAQDIVKEAFIVLCCLAPTSKSRQVEGVGSTNLHHEEGEHSEWAVQHANTGNGGGSL